MDQLLKSTYGIPSLQERNKRLSSWKSSTLSFGGRATLIKASVTSLLLYYMSLFPIPTEVIDKITKIQRRVFWGGNLENKCDPLLAWKYLELPKHLGELNFGNLHRKNVALLFKSMWRYF